MTYNPKISIIIPVYNAEQYIDECLQSIVGQTLCDIEIICVDDCSIDDSHDIIKKYQSSDDRFLYYKMPQNCGAGPCRNKGIELATGQYIAFMDSDDLYANNDILENLYNACEQNGLKVSGANLKEFFGDKIEKAKDWGKGTFTQNRQYDYSEYPYSLGYYRFIYNRKMIVNNDFYFPNYRRYQDPVWFARVMCHAQKFYGINDDVYLYRRFHQKISWDTAKIETVLKGMTENITLFKNNGYNRHIAREKIEYKNFVYRIIYDGLKTRNLSERISLVKKYNSANDIKLCNISGAIGFVKYGLILLKNKLK